METNALLGERIRELRKKRNLSQEQLAEMAGISSKYLSRIERGIQAPSIESLDKISAGMKVEIRDLFDFYHIAGQVPPTDEVHHLLKTASEEQLKTIARLIKAFLL